LSGSTKKNIALREGSESRPPNPERDYHWGMPGASQNATCLSVWPKKIVSNHGAEHYLAQLFFRSIQGQDYINLIG